MALPKKMNGINVASVCSLLARDHAGTGNQPVAAGDAFTMLQSLLTVRCDTPAWARLVESAQVDQRFNKT